MSNKSLKRKQYAINKKITEEQKKVVKETVLRERLETSVPTASSKANNWLAILVIVVVTFFAFYPALFNDFNNWDDLHNITENYDIRSLEFKNIKKIFTSYVHGAYQPFSTITYSFEYFFWELNPFPYHLNNVLLHCVNSVLVFFLILSFTGQRMAAFVVGLLFGIHPLHVESVAWVTERKDLVYSFFYILGLIAYSRYLKDIKTSQRFFWLTVIFFISSLLSKAGAITFPLILCLMDYYKNRSLNLRLILEKIPLFLLSIGFGVITIYAANTVHEGASGAYPYYDRVLISCYVLLGYFVKMIYPYKLSALYANPPKPHGYLAPIFYFAPLILAVIGYAMFRFRKVLKHINFGILFYVLSLSTVLKLISEKPPFMADRYAYMSSIGVFFVFTQAAHAFYSWQKENKDKIKQMMLMCFMIYVMVLSYQTFERTKIWKDSLTIWNDALSKDQTISSAFNNRGLEYLNRREYDKALPDFYKTLEFNPYNASAWVNIAIIYDKQGLDKEALEMFDQAIKLDPNGYTIYYNLALFYHHRGMRDLAIENYTKTVEYNPTYVLAYNNRAVLYAEQGLYDLALQDYQTALNVDPRLTGIFLNVAAIYSDQGKFDEALAILNKAIAMDPLYPDAYNNRGLFYFERKQYDLAHQDFQQALTIQPDYYQAYNNMGRTFFSQKRMDLALKAYDQALAIDPNLGDSHYNKGLIYFELEQYNLCIESFTNAIMAQPTFGLAYAYRSFCYSAIGKMQRAKDDAQKAIELGATLEAQYLKQLNLQ